jgi:hypothetical protein
MEHLKPSLMAMTAGGLFAGPVAQVARGTILIVLANRAKVTTIYIPAQPGRAEGLFAAIDGWDARNTPLAIDAYVKRWGGAPAGETQPVPPECGCRMLAVLFSALDAEQRGRVWPCHFRSGEMRAPRRLSGNGRAGRCRLVRQAAQALRRVAGDTAAGTILREHPGVRIIVD